MTIGVFVTLPITTNAVGVRLPAAISHTRTYVCVCVQMVITLITNMTRTTTPFSNYTFHMYEECPPHTFAGDAQLPSAHMALRFAHFVCAHKPSPDFN
jgi:hypothetical protein